MTLISAPEPAHTSGHTGNETTSAKLPRIEITRDAWMDAIGSTEGEANR